jgi:hypothetical protein
MAAGDRYAAEWRRWEDPATGAEITQLTSARCINHALYFLNQAWAFPHGRGVDRDGDGGGGAESCLIVTATAAARTSSPWTSGAASCSS